MMITILVLPEVVFLLKVHWWSTEGKEDTQAKMCQMTTHNNAYKYCAQVVFHESASSGYFSGAQWSTQGKEDTRANLLEIWSQTSWPAKLCWRSKVTSWTLDTVHRASFT